MSASSRVPASARYAWRWLLPVELAHALSFRYGDPVRARDLGAWWQQEAEAPRAARVPAL